MHSPETARRSAADADETSKRGDSEANDGNRMPKHRRHRRKHRDKDGSSQLMNDKYDRPPHSRGDEDDSEGTVDLPPRFDENGDRKHEEGGDALEGIIGNLASRFLGGGGGEEERSGRRRHRH